MCGEFGNAADKTIGDSKVVYTIQSIDYMSTVFTGGGVSW